MKTLRTVWPALACILGCAVAATPARGQSLYNAAGLGLPVEAADGRARALGSFGIGLWGSSVSPVDPAAAGMSSIPSAIMVAQPSWVDFQRGTEERGEVRGTRFPFVGIGYPLLSGTASVTFRSVFDQRFESTSTRTLDLPGGPLEVDDFFQQEGGVSAITVGYARRVTTGVVVGLNVGRYSGSLRRTLTRSFGDVQDPTAVQPFQTGGFWSYSGWSVTAGAAADVSTFLRVAASATWSSSLDATASDDSEGGDRSYDLPLMLRVGASGVLAPGLRLAASFVHADWSTVADDVRQEVTVGGTGGLGVGLELSRARLLGKEAPLRFGYRTNDLPFALSDGAASESAWTGGVGIVLNRTNDIVLAAVDLGLERGTRSDPTLTERFWRATVSLRVSGF